MDILGWTTTTLLAAFGGYFLRGYMGEKGKNLATHEDISKLVDQVRAVTTATKEIEARISDQVWNRQRVWELKSATLVEAARALGDFNNAVSTLSATYDALREISDKESPAYLRQERKALSAWNIALRSLQRAQLLVAIVSGNDVERSFLTMEKILKGISREITRGDIEVYAKTVPEISHAAHELIVALRKELGVE